MEYDSFDARDLRPLPAGAEPTRHLFVGNTGPVVGISENDIAEAFAAFGSVLVRVPDAAKGFVFVSFPNTEQATNAFNHATRDGLKIKGRLSVVQFAWVRLSAQRAPTTEAEVVRRRAEELGVPGLNLFVDFVTEDEEVALLQGAEAASWNSLAKRQVCHYGFEFQYTTRDVDVRRRLGDLPSFCRAIVERMEALPSIPKLDQLTINKYPLGVGLAPHIDTHSAFSGAILSLSLGSSCVMQFRQDDQKHSLFLPRRSLLVMSDEARFAWAHYIPHRKSDCVDGVEVPREPFRVSFTFRQVRNGPCSCRWPQHCDSQASTLPPTRSALRLAAEMHAKASCSDSAGLTAPHDASSAEVTLPCASDESAPGQAKELRPLSCAALPSLASADDAREADPEGALRSLEEEYVHRVYNAIANHFSATRFAIWPEVRKFIDSLPSGGVVADVGCGNGKYFDVRQDLAVLGSDRSDGLVEMAARRIRNLQGRPEVPNADVLVADGMALPFRAGGCDAVLCIAVLHHISSPARRLRFLRGLARLLRPGGRAIVTVWATEQEQPSKSLHKWTPITVPAGIEHGSAPLSGSCATGGAVTGNGAGEVLAMHLEGGDAEVGDASGDTLEERAAVRDGGQRTMPGEETAQLQADSQSRTQPPQDQEDEDDSVQRRLDAARNYGDNYYVPWNLPFHRAQAHLAALRARQAAATDTNMSQSHVSDREDGVAAPGPQSSAAAAVPAVGEIDESKRTVVFKRYYHLFAEGELDALVAELPGVQQCYSLYDASNWVVVFERTGS